MKLPILFIMLFTCLAVVTIIHAANSQETMSGSSNQSVSITNGSIQSGRVNQTKLHIAALVPLLYTYDAYTYHAAMKAAVRLINQDDTILRDYELVVDYYDSLEVAGEAYHAFYDIIEKNKTNQILIGPSFPDETRAVAGMTNLFKIPQITYATLNWDNSFEVISSNEVERAALEKTYPFLVKLAPSQVIFNEANIKMLQRFKWKRVAILYGYMWKQYFATAYALSLELRKAGIEPVIVQGFYEDSPVNVQLQAILDQDIRIIFGIFGTEGARRIFCGAYQWGMYGEKYQWIINNILRDDWWTKNDRLDNNLNLYNCTLEHRLKATDRAMKAAQTTIRRDDVTTASGLKPQKVWELVAGQKAEDYEAFDEYKPQTLVVHESALYGFDAVYLAAKTLEAVIKEKGESGLMTRYNDTEKAKYIVETSLKIEFEGVTGVVIYGGVLGDERLSDITMKQYQVNSNNTASNLEKIGYYNSRMKYIKYNGPDYTYFKAHRVIKDGITEVRIPRYYSVTQLAVMWSLVLAGLILSLGVLFINVRYRQIRMIKMSSPNINNGIIAGSIVCYVSVIIYGLDARFLSQYGIKIACNAVTATLSIGFTLCFGCLFSKTWRIYKIFTAAKTMDKVSIKDSHLYAIVVLLLGIDVLVFVLWIFIAPFSVEEVELDHKLYAQEDLVKKFFYYKCSCEYQLHFTVATYCYKGFLLIFGLFLAWETRTVKVAVLNDSKYIGMAVYNVCTVTAVGVICTSALYNAKHYATGYLVVTISIFLCTTGILLLIFVPKMYLLFGKSFDVTYGNISVRTFSSGGPLKSTVSNQISTSNSEVHSESSCQSGFPLSRTLTERYKSNRWYI